MLEWTSMIIQFQPPMLPTQPGLGWNQLPPVGQAGTFRFPGIWLHGWKKDKYAEIKDCITRRNRVTGQPKQHQPDIKICYKHQASLPEKGLKSLL